MLVKVDIYSRASVMTLVLKKYFSFETEHLFS